MVCACRIVYLVSSMPGLRGDSCTLLKDSAYHGFIIVRGAIQSGGSMYVDEKTWAGHCRVNAFSRRLYPTKAIWKFCLCRALYSVP